MGTVESGYRERGGMGGLEKAPELCSVTAFMETRLHRYLQILLAGCNGWDLTFTFTILQRTGAGERKSQSFTYFQWAGLDLSPEHLRL